jgi:hypothetical protein
LPGVRLKMAAFLERWLTEVVESTARPRTRRVYRQLSETHLIPELGKVPLAKRGLEQRSMACSIASWPPASVRARSIISAPCYGRRSVTR